MTLKPSSIWFNVTDVIYNTKEKQNHVEKTDLMNTAVPLLGNWMLCRVALETQIVEQKINSEV